MLTEQVPAPAGNQFVLDPKASYPSSQFDQIFNQKPGSDIWSRKNKYANASTDACAFELGRAAHNAGWSKQETVNLLIHFRRKSNEGLLLETDYYSRLLTAVESGESFDPGSKTTPDRAEAIKFLEAQLGLTILSYCKFLSDPPVYFLEILDFKNQACKVRLTIEQLRNSRLFANAVYGASEIEISSQTKAAWPRVLKAFPRIKEDVEVDPTETNLGKLRGWIKKFMYSKSCEPADDLTDIWQPFIKDGNTYINLKGFTDWIKAYHGDPQLDLSSNLKALGCKMAKKTHVTVGGKRTTVDAWQLPPELADISGI